MASISSGNTFSVASHSSNGMSGLVSGLDTDGMVEQMLSGTQSKIDKQEALKQQLTWKQEIYRELIGDINGFSDQFFNYDSATNFTSTNFFDMMVASTTSTAFKVTGTSSASTGATSVIVKQLAANAKGTSKGEASANSLTGKFDKAILDNRTVILEVGGVEKTIDLSDAAAKDANGKYTGESVVNYLNSLGAGFTAEINANGALTLTGAAGTEIRVSGKSDAYGLSMLGLSAYGTAAAKKDSDGKEISRVLSGKLQTEPELKMQVALDGVSTYVTLDHSEVTAAFDTNNWDKVKESLNKQLSSAFGTLEDGTTPMLRAEIDAQGNLSFITEGDGHQIQIAGDGLASSLIGIVSSQSSRISTSVAMKDVNFKEPLQGDEFKFEINGKDFTFTSNDSLYTVMKKINNSGAGVRVTYSALTDKFSIEATSAGSGDRIEMSQQQGNLLSAMFGKDNIASADTVASQMLGKDVLKGGSSFPSDFSGGTFAFNVNGKDYTYNFPQLKEGSTYSRDDVLKQINRTMQQQFGYVGDSAAGKKQAIELVYDGTDGFSLKVRNNAVVTFAQAETGSADQNLALKMGFASADSEKSNRLTQEDLDNIKIGDPLTDGDINPEIKSLLNKLGSSIEISSTGRLLLTSGVTLSDAADQAEFEKLFGTAIDKIQLGDGKRSLDFIEKGHNAIVSINGIETERSSNNFTVNGLNFELKSVTAGYENAQRGNKIWGYLDSNGQFVEVSETDPKAELTRYKWTAPDGTEISDVGKADTVTAERDVDKIFEGIKSFVEEYNKLVEKLNTYVYQDPNYKSYAPLTSAQKKEMTDREIEKWEEKSKEGLLRNDSDISMLLSSMRLTLYQKPKDAQYALYDLGIETGSAFAEKKDTGKLKLDETKFKQMLASDPEAIRQLFTDAEEGLSVKLKTAIDSAAKLSSGSAGSLVKLAGMSGYATDKNNTITNQITEIKAKIKDLNTKYQKERQKYWNQFNQMEQLIQQMNSQSSWLTQQFSM